MSTATKGSFKPCDECFAPIRKPRDRCRKCYRKWLKIKRYENTDPTQEQLEAMIAETLSQPLPFWWNLERNPAGEGERPDKKNWKKSHHRGAKIIRLDRRHNRSPII